MTRMLILFNEFNLFEYFFIIVFKILYEEGLFIYNDCFEKKQIFKEK